MGLLKAFMIEKGFDLISGLNIVEEIMLILGVLFFVCLAVVLILKLVKNQPLPSLTTYFIISIVMMGWPTIQKISYDGKVTSIEKATRQVMNNPDDQAAREVIVRNISRIESRATTDPKALSIIENARLIMKNVPEIKANPRNNMDNKKHEKPE
jgi:hypothetical protein